MISARCRHQEPVQLLPPPPDPPSHIIGGDDGKIRLDWTRYCNCVDFILLTTHVVLAVCNILWSVGDMYVVL